MSKCPSFRFYPSDFLGSPTVQLMDAAEVGAYTLLLCMAWESDRHGYLPDDDDKLRRWARMSREQWSVSRELLLDKFPVVDEGWRANPRMVKEAEKQQLYSEAQSRKGATGGRGNKKLVESSSFDSESSSFKNESPVKPAVAVAVAVTVTKKTKTPPLRVVEPSSVRKEKEFTLPEWISPDSWAGFEEMRREKRKEMTPRARVLLLSALEKLRGGGYDPNERLDTSTLNGWTSVYSSKDGPPPRSDKESTQPRLSAVDKVRAQRGTAA